MFMFLAALDQSAPLPGAACIYDAGQMVFQEQLPAPIIADLKQRAPEMSPAGGPFEATDVGEGPRDRFVAAARLNDRYIVAYEHGGRGYSIRVLTYLPVAGETVSAPRDQRFAFKTPICGMIAAALAASLPASPVAPRL
jgi:hypothetical protein